MNAYSLTLFVHSYLRWVVVVLAVIALVRAAQGSRARRAWEAADERITIFFIAAVDVQLLVGLLLSLVVSPLVAAARRDMHTAMHNHLLRFYTVEHATAMILAVAVVHIGRVRSKKLGADPTRHAVMLVTLAVWLGLVVLAMPWPWLSYGRPLLRVGM